MKRLYYLAPAMLCAVLAAPAAAGSMSALGAELTGAEETAGGDPDGSGRFAARIDSSGGDVCYTLTVDGIDEPTAAHIHSGAAGTDGPPVVELWVTEEGEEELCIAEEPDTLKAILKDPAAYYVNVHNEAFPAGAVRGQLAKPAKK